MASVIVFGPTGNVGSIAAQTAHKHGAKVHLAMRDTSKSIPGLSKEQEEAGGYSRVQADLTKPDTVVAAVKQSGAKRAFIYISFGSQDGMKPTIAALKEGGIEFVVLLSSYSVHGDPKQFTPDQLIPYAHAVVEISLNEIFGEDNYVAIRPGNFVTNLLQHKAGIMAGEVKLFGAAFTFDCITPDDMGTTAGTILANGSKNGQKKVYLYGPREIAMDDAVKEIGSVLGKEVKVTPIGEEEAREQYSGHGMPPPVVDYMIKNLRKAGSDEMSYRTDYEEGQKNVQLYTGRPAVTLREWVANNRQLFEA